MCETFLSLSLCPGPLPLTHPHTSRVNTRRLDRLRERRSIINKRIHQQKSGAAARRPTSRFAPHARGSYAIAPRALPPYGRDCCKALPTGDRAVPKQAPKWTFTRHTSGQGRAGPQSSPMPLPPLRAPGSPQTGGSARRWGLAGRAQRERAQGALRSSRASRCHATPKQR